MRRHPADEGAVLVMVAILLVVLFVFGALAVDVGYWYSTERQLQLAADAAALAGCQALIRGSDEAGVWSEVGSYRQKNETGLLDSAVLDTAKSAVDMDEGIVKVTLRTTASSVLSRVIGKDSAGLAAQAVAKAGYLAGYKNPVPWGMPILRPKWVTASTAAGASELTDADEDGVWSGFLKTTVPSHVTVTMSDAGNATTTIKPAASIIHDAVFSRISLTRITQEKTGSPVVKPNEYLFTDRTGDPSYRVEQMRVEVVLTTAAPAGDSVETRVGTGGSYTGLTTWNRIEWATTLQVPTTTDAWAPMTLNVRVGNGNSKHAVDVPFSVRRPTFPIDSIAISNIVYPPGGGSDVSIDVGFHDYEYGRWYPFKVGAGYGEAGKFMALDFGNVYHYPTTGNESPSPRAVYTLNSGSSYGDFLGRPPYEVDVVLRVGDAVWTADGAKVGQTNDAAWRCADGVTFAEWEAAGKPADSTHLVIIPIMQKIAEAKEGGKSVLRVESFGTFYLEDLENGWAKGYFVEYTAPSIVVVDEPPGPLNIKTAHLVGAPYLDF